MPFICIGPICIPWNVAIPALLLVGMPIWNRLPEPWRISIEKWWNKLLDAVFGTFPALDMRRKAKHVETLSDAQVALVSDQIKNAAGGVLSVSSMEMWEAVRKRAKELNVKVAVKLSAEWCKPCKRIAPVYEDLAAAYAESCIFCTADVDQVEDLAFECGATVLPTFQVMDSDGVLLKSMAGADEARLKQLLADALSSKKVN